MISGRNLREFWDPIKAYWKEKSRENAGVLRDSLLTIEATKWQYTNGVRNPETIAPENWFHDQYLLDFGKFGRRTSYGRFTQHAVEDVKGRLVLGVLNFDPRKMGEVISEVLVLGVQYPKAESGEATFVSPAVDAKVGGKLF